MYGPRSAYDSQTLADFDRRVAEKVFADQLIVALRDKRVREALRKALDEAEEEA